MKHVLLVGDSIRMGYDKSVRASLDGIAEVFFPEENCRFASYVLRYMHEYWRVIPEKRVDVLHWNAGLWDCLRLFGEDPHTPVEVYAYYIDRICQRIRKIMPDTEVIFATSTRVQSEKMDPMFKRYNEEIEAYNAAAVEVVKEYGFTVNDLYALSASLPDEAHSDPVHYYTPEGTRAFTRQVLDCLAPALGIEGTVEFKEELYTDEPIGI